MNQRTVRTVTVALPDDDLDLAERGPRDGETLADRLIGGDLLARATLTDLTITRTRLINADLASARLTNIRWNRVLLRGCTLVGANLSGGTMRDVLFEHCRLDSATFDQVRTVGPVAFLGCSLVETAFSRCGLGSVAFDGCKLAGTEFGSTDLRGADLRGQDLSLLVGVGCLRGAVISEGQVPGLTEALLAELALIVKPDLS